MENTVGKIIKMIGYIVIALGIIAGIVACIIVNDNFDGLAGFGAFIGTVISFFVSGIMIVGFSEVINLLQENNELLKGLQRRRTTKGASRNAPSYQEKADEETDVVFNAGSEYADFGCPFCGETISVLKDEVARGQLTCPYCGQTVVFH